MKQQEKQKWTEEVLQSMAGMRRAEPAHDLFPAISERMHKCVRLTGRIMPFKTVSAAAACILVLVAVNVCALAKTDTQEKAAMERFIRYYGLDQQPYGI